MSRLTPAFCNRVRAQWTRAYHARTGLLVVFSPYRTRTAQFPPYYIDPAGFGLGFVENFDARKQVS